MKNKEITTWFELARYVAVIPVSSASAERVFSMYTGILNDNQKRSLLDKVEDTLMIRMNHTYRKSQEKRYKKIKKIMEGKYDIQGAQEEAKKEAEKEEERTLEDLPIILARQISN